MTTSEVRRTDSLTPAEAARETGLSLDTLRYYEREGLIGPVDRTPGGTRRYRRDDIAWVGIVTCLRDAGLGIDDLRRFTELLRTEGGGSVFKADIEALAFLRRRRAELEERQRRTAAALRVLDDKIAHYGS